VITGGTTSTGGASEAVMVTVALAVSSVSLAVSENV